MDLKILKVLWQGGREEGGKEGGEGRGKGGGERKGGREERGKGGGRGDGYLFLQRNFIFILELQKLHSCLS